MGNGELQIFDVSVLGASHIRSGKPCQDASASWISEDGRSLAVVVSDGHGSDTYVRSDVGSRFAVEVTLRNIRDFISQNPSFLIGKRGEVTARDSVSLKDPQTEMEQLNYDQGQLFLRQVKAIGKQDSAFQELFSSIIEQWLEAIRQDAEKTPFSEEEKAKLGKNDLVKAYGATLMAYVQTPYYWFAFHIGDGRLLAANRRMEWKQIVPWDCNCFQNFTTSLCGADPLPSFRYAFDGTGNFPSAVFCCSDGIEDSYGDYDVAPETLHNFYSKLLARFCENGADTTLDELKEFLPRLSEKGSRDDMSLAGFLDPASLKSGLELFDLNRRHKEVEKEMENAMEKFERQRCELLEQIKVIEDEKRHLVLENDEEKERMLNRREELEASILQEKADAAAQWKKRCTALLAPAQTDGSGSAEKVKFLDWMHR